jgi:hypothetical protein
MESSIRDVIADPAAWAVVLPTILRYLSTFNSVDGTEDSPVGSVVRFHPEAAQMRADIEAALLGLQR